MTREELDAIIDGLCDPICDLIDKKVAKAVEKAIEPYAEKLDAAMKFRSVWSHERWYAPGDTVLRSSLLWVCRAGNAGQMPGTANGAQFWQAAGKNHGRDDTR